MENGLAPHRLTRLCEPLKTQLSKFLEQKENLLEQYLTTLQHHLILSYKKVTDYYENELDKKIQKQKQINKLLNKTRRE